MKRNFVTLDSKDKYRLFTISYKKIDSGYVIKRSSGIFGGKQTFGPELVITSGRCKRTVLEQTELQYNSLIKKQLDKGYIEIPENTSEEDLKRLIPKTKTNQVGVIKPMLCKKSQDITNPKIFNKEWLISRKINGVRCLMYWNGSELHTASRGGTNYDAASTHLRTHPILIEIFKDNPDLILDFELYKYGKSLQDCSGAARLESFSEANNWLEMYVYDCYFKDQPNLKAKDRIDFLRQLAELYNFSFNPTRIWKDEELKLQMVPHEKISGWNNMKKLHDEFVSDGWEGAVIRNPESIYKPGSRGSDWIKIKNYQSNEFPVIGYELGLRGVEDMTFICLLPDKRTFKVSPNGDKDLKQEYINNFDKKYKGHLLECSYFDLSNDGIPTQGKGVIFRFDLE